MFKLSDVVDQFLETALWASLDEEGRPLDRNWSVDDFSAAARARAEEICGDFLSFQASRLERCGLEEDTIGHNLFLTANRHGTGFWDIGLAHMDGAILTSVCHGYGEIDPYVADEGVLELFG